MAVLADDVASRLFRALLFSASESLSPAEAQQGTDDEADRRNLKAEIDDGVQDRHHRSGEGDGWQIPVGTTPPATAQTHDKGHENRGKSAHRGGNAEVQ